MYITFRHIQSTTLPKATTTANGPALLGNALSDLPWFDDPFRSTAHQSGTTSGRNKFMTNSSNMTFLGWWTYPYYQCSSRRWILTYSIPVTSVSSAPTTPGDRYNIQYYIHI